jgi:hypothetical protein
MTGVACNCRISHAISLKGIWPRESATLKQAAQNYLIAICNALFSRIFLIWHTIANIFCILVIARHVLQYRWENLI